MFQKNDNGRRVIDFCAERGFCVEHKSLHKCTRVIRGQDEMELLSMIDLVLVKKDILFYLKDMRGMG